MPLHWKIAPLEHMVVCVAEGLITLDGLMEYFAALEAAGATHYRKILDATRGRNGLSKDEVARMAAAAKSRPWSAAAGPIAVVTGSRGNDEIVANVRAMLRPGRRMREFQTIHEAREWLEREPLGRLSAPPSR
jgi:hypothetical protein